MLGDKIRSSINRWLAGEKVGDEIESRISGIMSDELDNAIELHRSEIKNICEAAVGKVFSDIRTGDIPVISSEKLSELLQEHFETAVECYEDEIQTQLFEKLTEELKDVKLLNWSKNA